MLKLCVETLVLDWCSRCWLDRINHFTQIFQVHVKCFKIVEQEWLHVTALQLIWKQERGPCFLMHWLLVLPQHIQLSGMEKGCAFLICFWSCVLPRADWQESCLPFLLQAEKWDLRSQSPKEDVAWEQPVRGCVKGFRMQGPWAAVPLEPQMWAFDLLQQQDEMVKSCSSALHQVGSCSADCEGRLFP